MHAPTTPAPLRPADALAALGLALAALLAAAAAAAETGRPWEEGPAFAADPAAVLAAATALPPPEDEEVDLLLAESELVLDGEGVVTTRVRRLYRILTRAGVDGWSALEHQWSPWYQNRPALRARVIRTDGSVRELDPATAAEAPLPGMDPSLYEDTRRLRAPLPGTEVGAVVETEVTIERQRPFFAAGEAHRLLLSEYGTVRLARAALDLPRALEPNVRWTEVEPPARAESGDRVRLTFTALDLPSLADREFGTPAGEKLGPSIGFTTGRSWREVVAAYAAIVEDKLAGAEVGDLLDGLGDPAEDRDRWLAALLTRLHRRVRYTGIEFDEARIVPRTPAETLARGFGDCKDKAVLLVAALRRAGVPADVALLRTAHFSDADPELPGLGMFDHAIVHVGGPEPLWIDATDPYSRPGELADADRDRLALVVGVGADGLVRTPAATAADNRRIETRELFLSEHGKGRAVETSEYHGSLAANLRGSWDGTELAAVAEGLESYVESAYHSEETPKVEMTDPDDLTEPFRLRIEAGASEAAWSDLVEATAIVYPSALLEDLHWQLSDTEGEERKGDLAVTPYSTEITYRIHLPPGLVLRELPESAEDDLGPARMVRRWETAAEGREVVAHLSLTLDRRRLTAVEVQEVRDGVTRLGEQGAGAVVVWFDQSVQAHLKAGRTREALDEAERLIALHPGEALHRLQLSAALLAAGLGAEARREARLATEMEPESALAWATLGRTLTHDEVGRHLHSGYDRAGAVAALERAAELDPEDHAIVADRAITLEHDEDGLRYAPGSDLDAAIAAYLEIGAEQLAEYELPANLPAALVKAGRYEELREEAKKLADPTQKALYGVLATAFLDGVETAVREAERLQPATQARLELLTAVGQELAVARRYADAAGAVAAASRLSPQPAALLGQAEILRRTVRHEEVARDEAAPITPFVRLFELMSGDGEPDPAAVRELFAASLRHQADALDVEELRAGVGAYAAAKAPGVARDVMLDLALAALTVTTDGDPASGLRARFEMPGVPSRRLFLTREDGRLRLVTFATFAEPIGYEVLARLDRGEHEAARQWLDWAHEEVYVPKDRQDPLLGSAIWHFWERGDAADPERMRLAALALVAGDDQLADRIVEALEAARAQAPEEERWRLDVALIEAHRSRRDDEGLIAAGERLAGRFPDSEILFSTRVGALVRAGRTDDAVRLAEERLAAHPDDPPALRELAEMAIRRRDYQRAGELYDRLETLGKANGNDLNTAAWMALVRGRPEARDLERAQRATAMAGFQGYSTLNTLAALYAADGRAAEAYQLLLQSLEAAGRDPEGPDWYVVGLMAEGLGLAEAAMRCYERAAAPAEGEDAEAAAGDAELYPLSTEAMAGERLAGLRAAAAEAGGAP